MKNLLKYKEYYGTIECDLEDNILYGKVLFIKDKLGYHGENPEDLQKDFQETIDDYLEFCKEKGIEPDKPFSGTFNIRTGEELHRKLAVLAKENDLSLNAFVSKGLEKIADNPDLIL
ncbi:MAG: type II toxin-antitoxin system HicB family antitoxin [Desulforegulaceae bacterium]|jgi:predicted HicB family RNase H-like nuclease|nr:type II toxin-antitoxin system HicB family antitoxin [Desulforegulaceae bacterium]